MKELYVEGLATRGDPESCVASREGRGEALTGARAGRAIEPRNPTSGCPRCPDGGRQHPWSRYREWPGDPARSEIHGMYGTSVRENRDCEHERGKWVGCSMAGTRTAVLYEQMEVV